MRRNQTLSFGWYSRLRCLFSWSLVFSWWRPTNRHLCRSHNVNEDLHLVNEYKDPPDDDDDDDEADGMGARGQHKHGLHIVPY